MNRSFKTPAGKRVVFRPLRKSDSIAELTALLHRAYKIPADEGIVFYASHQTEAETRERIAEGKCFLGTMGEKTVATITIYHGTPSKCEWYNREGVWFFGQFAVEPALQNSGIGTAMINAVERYARAHGATELALDTAENATRLIAYYCARGFRPAGRVQWDVVEHRSVVMSKRLI